MIGRQPPLSDGRRWRRRVGHAGTGDGARTLHIGVVLHDFALGGTERIAVRLAAAWAETGVHVTIFCGSTDGPLLTMPGDAVDVIAAGPPIARGRGSRRRLGRAAAGWFERHPVDIVFVPGNFHWTVVPALARLPRAVRPAIVAQVSASLDKPQRGWLRRLGFGLRMQHLLRGADAIAALCDVARDQADMIAGGRRARTIALPALADDVAAPVPLPETPTIVAAGRLVREKGFADLIDAFAMLDDDSARLVIVGAGPEEGALRDHAVSRGVADRVALPGYAPDIRPWLDAARLFVLSSHFEGFPAVLVEALAAGRPVVATACTPAAALFDGPMVGRTVPIRDPGAMATAIAGMLATAPADPQALADRVAHHRIGPVADAYLGLFAEVAPRRSFA